MKVKQKWDGITLELKCKENGSPLAFKQRFEGTDEATKVLVHNEQVNIDGILVKIGGFDLEVEISIEESIQNIKNIRDICTLIREETNNFVDFIPTIITKIDGVMPQKPADLEEAKHKADFEAEFGATEFTAPITSTNTTIDSIIEAGVRSIKEAVAKATGK